MLATVMLSAALLVTSWLDWRTYWNLLWMIAIPFVIAWQFEQFANEKSPVWPLTGLCLLPLSLLSMAFVANNVFAIGY